MNFKVILKYIVLFLIGGFTYYLIEILWRGYSQWTMICLGGICFILMGYINEFYSWDTPLWKQCGMSALIITVLEFITGCIINIKLGWNVWNYSDIPFNLLGQVCLPYSVLWVLLSYVGIFLDDFIRWKCFGEEKPRYKLF